MHFILRIYKPWQLMLKLAVVVMLGRMGVGGGGGGQEEEFWASLSSVNIYFTIQHLATWMCLMVKTDSCDCKTHTAIQREQFHSIRRGRFYPSSENDYSSLCCGLQLHQCPTGSRVN